MPKKYNLPYKDTPAIPKNWSLPDDAFPGEVLLYYKNPDTDLISPATPEPWRTPEEQACCVEYSTPQRDTPYVWDIGHRDVACFGCNEEQPPFANLGSAKVLNEFDPNFPYNPWVKDFCFQEFAPQRGLFWHWIRYYSIITASRLDTILYNGYIENDSIDRYNTIVARQHLFEVLTCQIPQETVVNDSNIEENHLYRGVFGEELAQKSLSERSDRHPTILVVGSAPMPGYRWIRVSLDGIDAKLGINYEMKAPRPLRDFFKNYALSMDEYAKVLDFQQNIRLVEKPFVFTNPAMEAYRTQCDFLVMDALERQKEKPVEQQRSYTQLFESINEYTFKEEPFADFGRAQERFAPNGFLRKQEKSPLDLGYYFFQANIQDQIGVSSTELVKWDCLTGCITATEVKRRPDMFFKITIELQKFWDQVHAYRVKHQITFRDFYKVNELWKLGESLYENF